MSFSSFRTLLDRYEKTKKELGETDRTIRRITGRDPEDISNGITGSKFRLVSASTSMRAPYSGRKRPLSYVSKKEAKESSHDEDSYEEDDEDDGSPKKKPTLQSTVVASRCEGRSRKATIQEQNANSKIKARNRRMFGALIGTLEKFQHEEKKRQHKESMRVKIEEKVEAATEEERERIKKEKEALFLNRREQQTQLRCLEKKLERAESHDVFDQNHNFMLNFIKTRSKPAIFFLPSTHTPATKRALEDSRDEVLELIKEKKEILEKDLAEIEDLYKKESLPGQKENGDTKEESDSHDVPESEAESLVVEQEDTGFDNEDSNNTKTVNSVADQDFEPIYD